MALKGDLALYLSGGKVPLKDCNIYISQPSLLEIAASGEDDFFMAIQMLGKTDVFLRGVREGNPQLASYGDFHLLLVILNEEANSKRLVLKFLDLVFPDYQFNIADNSIDFSLEGRAIGRITPYNFANLQEVILELFVPHHKDDRQEEYNPADDKAAEIAAKLQRGREKIQNMKNSGKAKNGPASIIATYSSIIAVGLGLNITDVMKYTLFQIYDVFNRYSSKIRSDLDMSIRLQPFVDTSKLDAPEDWREADYYG